MAAHPHLMHPPTRTPSANSKLALSIEDDNATQTMLMNAFEGTEIELEVVGSVEEGLRFVRDRQPALILLDLTLPDANGIDFISEVRAWSQVPILVLSGTNDESIKVQALYAGAEDYVTKPFSVGELMARVKVALRHAQTRHPSPRIVSFGVVTLDHERREVFVRGERVAMTPLEFSLLSVLMEHPGETIGHRRLLSRVWGDEFATESQYLRVYIGYLRRKIEVDPTRPSLLLTEAGLGYRLSEG
jgi:two-component system KDP operon response regulator KdpE